MTIEEIKRSKKEIEEKYGEWTADDIKLADGIYTISPRPVKDKSNDQSDKFLHTKVFNERVSSSAARIKRIIQIIYDNTNKPIEELRILDLACLEGAFSIELAMRGATIIAIEGRPANIAKANYAKEVLSLKNLDFVLDDVLNVNKEKYGKFDIVLCLGILYHLDTPDAFHFLEKIGEMCEMFMIVDTQLATMPKTSSSFNGKVYWGQTFKDHEPNASEEDKLKNVWMSLNNIEVFLLTRFSLVNLLQQIGFSSVYECMVPVLVGLGNRTTFLAIKGKETSALLSTTMPDQDVEEYTEIDTGNKDSELHLLNNELSKLKTHPYVRFGISLYQYLRKLKRSKYKYLFILGLISTGGALIRIFKVKKIDPTNK